MNIIVNCQHPDGLTPDEQVFLHLLRNDINTLSSLLAKDLLKIDKEHLISSGYIFAWRDNVKNIIVSKRRVPKSQAVEEWIEDYRALFKNKKSGAMGTRKTCIEKMIKFIKEYPEYSDPELILAAATRYINTQRASGYTYLQRADYVISKKDSDSVTSRLAAFCEEVAESENKVEVFNQAGRQTI